MRQHESIQREEKHTMRGVLFGLAAGVLSLGGLATSATPALADHHGRDSGRWEHREHERWEHRRPEWREHEQRYWRPYGNYYYAPGNYYYPTPAPGYYYRGYYYPGYFYRR
jgi:hypothetical protein